VDGGAAPVAQGAPPPRYFKTREDIAVRGALCTTACARNFSLFFLALERVLDTRRLGRVRDMMTNFEYKVVPAPMRGLKAKGVKGTPARFANALQTVMNSMGAQGWEYQRTDTLPVEERQGLTGKSTSFQTMLVFRRRLVDGQEATAPVAALIEDHSDAIADGPEPEAVDAVEPDASDPQKAPIAARQQDDAPIDDTAPVGDMAVVDAQIDPVPDRTAQTDGVPLDSVKARVSQTLKSEGFSFPWNKRALTAKRRSDDQLPAE